MKITFTKIAWEDYSSWQNEDKKALKKINALIKEIMRAPFEGTGYWSRRIDHEHRLINSGREKCLSIAVGSTTTTEIPDKRPTDHKRQAEQLAHI